LRIMVQKGREREESKSRGKRRRAYQGEKGTIRTSRVKKRLGGGAVSFVERDNLEKWLGDKTANVHATGINPRQKQGRSGVLVGRERSL